MMIYTSRKNKIISLALSLLLSTQITHTLEPVTMGIAAAAAVAGVGGGAYAVFGGKDKEAADDEELSTEIEGMASKYPKKLGSYFAQIRLEDELYLRGESLPEYEREFKNVLLLWGETGNGKTMSIQQFTKSLNCTVIQENASSIVNKYSGSGANRIKAIFEDATARTEKGELVVIYIEELEELRSGRGGPDSHDEHGSASKELSLQLTACEGNKRIIFIGTTNNPEKLDGPLLRRLRRGMIEIKNPNPEQRKDVFAYMLKKETNHDLNTVCPKKCLSRFLSATNDMSNADLGDIAIAVQTKAKSSCVNEAVIHSAVQHVIRQKKEIEEKKKKEAEERRLEARGPAKENFFDGVTKGTGYATGTAIVGGAVAGVVWAGQKAKEFVVDHKEDLEKVIKFIAEMRNV